MANQKKPQNRPPPKASPASRRPPGRLPGSQTYGPAPPQNQAVRRPSGTPSSRPRNVPPPRGKPPPPQRKKTFRRKRPAGQRPPQRPKGDPRSRQIQQIQQQRKRKRKRNYTLHYILLFLFLSVTGVVLSLTVFFNIEAIEVRGSSIYTETEVLPYLGAKEGDNLLRLNTGQLEDTLLRILTQADDIRVSRVFPSRLRVEITDGISAAQLECQGQYYVISSGGRILQITSELQPENGVLILGIDLTGAIVGDYASAFLEQQWKIASETAKADKQPLPEKPTQFSDLQALFSALEESQFFDVNAVDISDSGALIIYWQNRLKIQLGSFSELVYKLKFVRAVLSGEEYQGIIREDTKGVLDAREIDAGLSFRPDPSLELPAEGGKLWSWDSGKLEDEAIDNEASLPDESAESSFDEDGQTEPSEGVEPSDREGGSEGESGVSGESSEENFQDSPE